MPTQAEIKATYEANPGGYEWRWCHPTTRDGAWSNWRPLYDSPMWEKLTTYEIRPIAPTRTPSATELFRHASPTYLQSALQQPPSDDQDRLVLAEGSESARPVEPPRAPTRDVYRHKNTGDPVSSPALKAKFREIMDKHRAPKRDVYLHAKTGDYYILESMARMESDQSTVAVYRSMSTKQVWVRPSHEFLARFERVGEIR